MKKLILSLSLITVAVMAQSAYSQDAAQLKAVSLQACDAQAAQIPEAQKEMVTNMCKCTVENTDYTDLLAKTAAGDMASVQADALAVAQKCSQANQ